jgi:hypothetical protein
LISSSVVLTPNFSAILSIMKKILSCSCACGDKWGDKG